MYPYKYILYIYQLCKFQILLLSLQVSCFSVRNDSMYVVSIAAPSAICLVGGKHFPLLMLILVCVFVNNELQK